MAWGAGPHPSRLGWFFVAPLALGVAAGLWLGRTGAFIPAGFFVGPWLLAGSTAGRGDNDGLWALIFPTTLVVSFIGVLLCLLAAAIRKPAVPIVPVPAGREVLALLLVMATAWWMTASNWPNPFSKLEAITDVVAAEASIEGYGITRTGNPLCSNSCGPRVYRAFVSPVGGDELCERLRQAVAKSLGTTLVTDGCPFEGLAATPGLGEVYFDSGLRDHFRTEPGTAYLVLEVGRTFSR